LLPERDFISGAKLRQPSPSAARCPIQKNAGVTSMESLRYKEFCCPFEIARFELRPRRARAASLDSFCNCRTG
jgi:hypothetical protein